MLAKFIELELGGCHMMGSDSMTLCVRLMGHNYSTKLSLCSKLTVGYGPRLTPPNCKGKQLMRCELQFKSNYIDSWDWNEKLMNSMRISLHQCQYPRYDWELQNPCAMTTQGSTPRSKRCVVPPIWNPWPLTDERTSFSQTSLQWSRNQVLFICAQDPSDVSKVKRGTVVGTAKLEDMWCSKEAVALQLQVESDMLRKHDPIFTSIPNF